MTRLSRTAQPESPLDDPKQSHLSQAFGITCPKCGQSNSTDTRRCASCGTHLLVFCYRCGHENLRTTQTYLQCGTNLHVKHRHHDPQGGVVFPGAPFSIRGVQVIAVVFGLLIAAVVISQWDTWFSATRDFMVPRLARTSLEEAPPEWFRVADLMTLGPESETCKAGNTQAG